MPTPNILYVQTDALPDAAREVAGGLMIEQTSTGCDILIDGTGSRYPQALLAARKVAQDLTDAGHTAEVVE